MNFVGKGGADMHEYDDAVLACFLKKQKQLFPEDVAETPEEAEAFLEYGGRRGIGAGSIGIF